MLWLPLFDVDRKYEPLASQSLLLRCFGGQTPQKVGDQPRQPFTMSRTMVPFTSSRADAPPPTMEKSFLLHCPSSRRFFATIPL